MALSNNAMPQLIRVYCEDCQKLIPKKTNQSWKDYADRKYCNRTCLHRNQSKIQLNARAELTLPDGTIMPLGNYIKKNTESLRDTADFYIGITKHVNRLEADADKVGKYKGLDITIDVLDRANRFLVDNSIGKPSQRIPEPDTDDRTEDQKMEELKYTMRELGYELVKIGE